MKAVGVRCAGVWADRVKNDRARSVGVRADEGIVE